MLIAVNLDNAGSHHLQKTAAYIPELHHSTFLTNFRHEPPRCEPPGSIATCASDLPLIADLELIRQRRQALIDEQQSWFVRVQNRGRGIMTVFQWKAVTRLSPTMPKNAGSTPMIVLARAY
jgi:hypothetical protein